MALDTPVLQRRTRSGGEAMFIPLSNKGEKTDSPRQPSQPPPDSMSPRYMPSGEGLTEPPLLQDILHQSGLGGFLPSIDIPQPLQQAADRNKMDATFRYDMGSLEKEIRSRHKELNNLSEQMNDLKIMDPQDSSLAKLQTFLEMREKESRMVRDELARLQRDKKVLTEVLSQMAKDVMNKEAAIKVQERQLQEKDSVIRTYVKGLQSKEEFIMEQVKTIQQKDESLREHARLLNERDDIILQKDKVVQEKERHIKDQARELRDKEQTISEQVEALQKKEDLLRDRTDELDSKQEDMTRMKDDLKHKEDIIKAQTQCLLDKEDRITEQKLCLETRAKTINEQLIRLEQRDTTIGEHERDISKMKTRLEDARMQLIQQLKMFARSSSEDGQLPDGGAVDVESFGLEELLHLMESSLQRDLRAIRDLKAEVERLDTCLQDITTIKDKLDAELSEALNQLENLRKHSNDTIQSLEEDKARYKENLSISEQERKEMKDELETMKEKYRQVEDSARELRQKLADTDYELESFRSQVVQTTFAIPGMVMPTGPVSARTVVDAIEQVAGERNDMVRKIAELKGALRQERLATQADTLAQRQLQDTLANLEEELTTKGRWVGSMRGIIKELEGANVAQTLAWVKEAILAVYSHESHWQTLVESALKDCGVELTDVTKDGGEVITTLYSSLQEQVQLKDKCLQDLQKEYNEYKIQTAEATEGMKKKMEEEAEEKLQRLIEEKKNELEAIREEILKKTAEEAKTELEAALLESETRASDAQQAIRMDKDKQIEELQKLLETSALELQQKEEQFTELKEKLAVAEEEILGKSDSFSIYWEPRPPVEGEIERQPPAGQSDRISVDITEKADSLKEPRRVSGQSEMSVERTDMAVGQSHKTLLNVSEQNGIYEGENQSMFPRKGQSLKEELQRLRRELYDKTQENETLRKDFFELQEKSNQLMSERMRRPSSVPASRKGRYAMNLERLVQNLSIENASYKLQLEQRDGIILDLRQQIGTLKQRHLPANCAQLHQRELDEMQERLQQKDCYAESLRQDVAKLATELNNREMIIKQLKAEIKQTRGVPSRHMDIDRGRKLQAEGISLGIEGNGTGEKITLPGLDQLIRCRYCKHDRSGLLIPHVHETSRSPPTISRTTLPIALKGLQPEVLEIRRPSRRSSSLTRQLFGANRGDRR